MTYNSTYFGFLTNSQQVFGYETSRFVYSIDLMKIRATQVTNVQGVFTPLNWQWIVILAIIAIAAVFIIVPVIILTCLGWWNF